MSKNDEQISGLLKSVEQKRASLGTKPRASWRTNGILKLEDGKHVNINTVTTLDGCVEAVAYLLKEQSFVKQASELLGVAYTNTALDEYVADFKLRAQMIQWDGEKRKLEALEGKLKDLRSEDAKTADALTALAAELG